jgi:hypothetical protein
VVHFHSFSLRARPNTDPCLQPCRGWRGHLPGSQYPHTPPCPPFLHLPASFFGSYLSGAMILVVMGIGSTAPGLLQVAIDRFSQVFPDYRQRVLQHEAAHFLVRWKGGDRGEGCVRVERGGGRRWRRDTVRRHYSFAAAHANANTLANTQTTNTHRQRHKNTRIPPPPSPLCQVGYLLGLPVTGYSVAITSQHVEFAEAQLQARIFTKDLSEKDVDQLAAVSVAGARLFMRAGSPARSGAGGRRRAR